MKVIVVGNGGVGKTSLIKRFCKNVFTEDYKKTIGVDFLEKEVQIPETGQTIRVMLWVCIPLHSCARNEIRTLPAKKNSIRLLQIIIEVCIVITPSFHCACRCRCRCLGICHR